MQKYKSFDAKKELDSHFFQYRNEIDFERIKLLYKAGRSGLVSIFLIVALFPLFMVNRLDHKIIAIWTILIIVVNLPRVFILRAFNSRVANNLILLNDVKRWEYYFIGGFCASGVLWSSTAFLPYTGNIVISLLFVVLVQVGISSVVVSMYSSSRNMVLIYLCITLVPPLLRLFVSGDRVLILVGITGVVFLLILTRAVIQQSRNLIEFISLKIQNDEFSKKDILTGLWNRRQLYDVVKKLIPRSIRHNEIFSVIMMDIDFFKNYNDTRGHTAGDELLQNIARLIQSAIREEDIAVRYGGEEFLLILPLASAQEAYEIGDRIRQVVKLKTEVTLSGGIATFAWKKSFDEITLEADRLLYKAKESGRDMICVEHSDVRPKNFLSSVAG